MLEKTLPVLERVSTLVEVSLADCCAGCIYGDGSEEDEEGEEKEEDGALYCGDNGGCHCASFNFPADEGLAPVIPGGFDEDEFKYYGDGTDVLDCTFDCEALEMCGDETDVGNGGEQQSTFNM